MFIVIKWCEMHANAIDMCVSGISKKINKFSTEYFCSSFQNVDAAHAIAI